MYQVTKFSSVDGSCPFDEFYNELKGSGVKNAQQRVKAKVQKLEEVGLELLNTEMMDRIEGNIFELRPRPFRVLCYHDATKGSFILLNGFRKTTGKTPEDVKVIARVLVEAYLGQRR